MNDSEFHRLVDNIYLKIEECINNLNNNNDIDCEINNNILILNFKDKNKIIINRQESLYQIWLATKHNGYHFDLKNGIWICNRSGKTFWFILEQEIITLTGEKINFV